MIAFQLNLFCQFETWSHYHSGSKTVTKTFWDGFCDETKFNVTGFDNFCHVKTVLRGNTTSMDRLDEARIQQLFAACDLNNSGCIEYDDLKELCADLAIRESELIDVFRELDINGDGKITITEFTKGFQSVETLFTRTRTGRDVHRAPRESVPSYGQISWDAFSGQLSGSHILIPWYVSSIKIRCSDR